MTKPFTHYLRVRYSECDAQQIVFNAKYAEYVDIAATEFTRAIWGDYADVLAQGIDNQVVSLKIDWQAPAKFDEVLAIQVDVEHIGNTSYAFKLYFSNHAKETRLAEATIVYVCVDSKTYQKKALPEHLREKLAAGAAGKSTNHAGITL